MCPDPDQQWAAVDLGSNSFHMIIARVVSGQLAVLDRMKERVQLAAGFDENNDLTPEAMQRGVACLERFGQRLATLPSVRVRAVGTNTLRKAKNAGEFLAEAEQALGHPIEIIPGREEARIIYLGAAHGFADNGGRRLVIDIGGGSTECIIGQRFEPEKTESLHIGCVSYSLEFFADGKIRREGFRDAVTSARVELETFEREYRRAGWDHAVGASGTILAIDSILRANGWGTDGITRDGLRCLREAMIEAGRMSKLTLPGLSSERASVLPGGLAILMGCFRSFKITTMSVSSGALREGLLYDTIGRNTHEDVRIGAVERLMRRYEVDRAQAERVESTALRCLEQVADAWSLHQPDLRALLSWASRLHEVGLALSYSGYHNHSAYLVQHSDMAGFSRERKAVLAAIIQAHRRRFRGWVLEGLRAVGSQTAMHLTVLLRLAATLNRSRDPAPLPAFTLVARDSTLALRFPEGWLAARAMTRADLAQEREYLAVAGFDFSFS